MSSFIYIRRSGRILGEIGNHASHSSDKVKLPRNVNNSGSYRTKVKSDADSEFRHRSTTLPQSKLAKLHAEPVSSGLRLESVKTRSRLDGGFRTDRPSGFHPSPKVLAVSKPQGAAGGGVEGPEAVSAGAKKARSSLSG
jgi:hypothetical protein